jgi:hypothetical protein
VTNGARPEWAPETAWPTGVEDEESEDRVLLDKIRDSELWRTIRIAIEQEREALLQTQPETNKILWRREGAMQMLTYLMHHGPTLVVLTARRERRKGDHDGG